MQKFLKHWPSYLFVCMMVPGLRYYYGRSDCEGLLWILTPVVRLVRFVSGMDFVYLAGCGYVNHRYRFVVAPSCAGIRFLTIAMGMLIFSFVHRMNSRKQGMVWTLSASAAAYGYTVLVNSIRILLSIHLPRVLGQVAGKEGRLTAERLHTMIGTGVYFVSLLILYGLAEHVLEKILNRKKAGGTVSRPAAPVCWYAAAVLILPFMKQAAAGNLSGTAGYAWTVLGVCSVVLITEQLFLHLRHALLYKKRIK